MIYKLFMVVATVLGIEWKDLVADAWVSHGGHVKLSSLLNFPKLSFRQLPQALQLYSAARLAHYFHSHAWRVCGCCPRANCHSLFLGLLGDSVPLELQRGVYSSEI